MPKLKLGTKFLHNASMTYAMKSHPIHHFKTPDPALPQALWNVIEPPENLYIQGSERALDLLHQLPDRGLAIVGTRNPHARSQAFLEKRVLELEHSRLVIVSGLARGIDACAHATALKAGLPTIGILGTGVDIPYPNQTLHLREKILNQGGLIISEFAPGTRGFQSHFLQRNRLIAGWTQATWVVEAGHKSGALNTARWARDQDRTVFTVPGFPGDPTLAGNQVLLDRDHALPIWGVHSLSATWLELLDFPLTKKKQNVEVMKNVDAESLSFQVRQMTVDQGGAQVPELLDWAISGGWAPTQFFTALQVAFQSQWIREVAGTILSIE